MRSASKEDPVPVGPSPLRVLDVIEPDKHIAFPDQLEVSQVREQIRLHDPDSVHPPGPQPIWIDLGDRASVYRLWPALRHPALLPAGTGSGTKTPPSPDHACIDRSPLAG
jgi:hypothetical protein